jgi:hypothetical protein
MLHEWAIIGVQIGEYVIGLYSSAKPAVRYT